MRYIKQCLALMAALVVLFASASGALVASRVSATSSNLLTNADLSQTDTAGNPVDFSNEAWGSNTASFNLTSDGQGGIRALHAAINNYQDGDAKWYHNGVAVIPGDQYTYSDAYRSDAVTNYWTQYADNNNQLTYRWLGQTPAASDWTPHSVSFTVPSNVASMAIFHTLNANGYLDTNSFQLLDTTPPTCNAATVNGVVNGGFEDSCDGGQTPAVWRHAVYGTADAQFAYLANGHSGSRSVSVTVSGTPAGEAGWYTAPFGVTANNRLQLTFWHYSSAYVYAYIEFAMQDGSTQYAPLSSVPASGSVWSQYQDIFLVPTGALTAKMHFATSSVGTVQLDDVALQQLPIYATNSFNRPLISIDFDDGWRGTYTNGLPVMQSFGFKGTFFLNDSTLNTTGAYMTNAQVKNLVIAGDEIGSHGYQHLNLVTLSPADVETQVSKNKTLLQQLTAQPITNFATPYSSFNSTVLDTIMKYHASQRDTSGALNYKYSFNYRQVHSKVITSDTTVAQIQQLIAQAKANNAWLILTFHDVGTATSGGDGYTVAKATLRQYLQEVKNSGLLVVTNQAALQEITPQL